MTFIGMPMANIMIVRFSDKSQPESIAGDGTIARRAKGEKQTHYSLLMSQFDSTALNRKGYRCGSPSPFTGLAGRQKLLQTESKALRACRS